MNRREMLSSLFGLTALQAPRELKRLTRLSAQCPVCQSKDVLDKLGAVREDWGYSTLTIATNASAHVPAMLEVACGNCGVCYLVKNQARP